jgi:hypothetical protein
MPTSWPSRPPPRDRDPDRRPHDEQTADYGRLAVYAVLTASTVWVLMQLPEMAAAQTRAQTIRAEAMDRKIRDMCEQRGFDPRTHEHTLCTMDLKAQRRAEQISAYMAFISNSAAVR